MIASLLIANRGEIACRIIRTARRMGIHTIAVYSDADRQALHVRTADEAVHIGPSPAMESYLRGDRIIAAAKAAGAEAIHPGYGFLSENAGFAQAVIDAGLIWVGPDPASIEAMGLKDRAKALMAAAGVPVTPGYQGEDQSPARLKAEAEAIGYPVLIKAVAGGGGKGMRLVDNAQDFDSALESCQREAEASFSNSDVLIEKFIANPRHIEVQIFGDRQGNVVHLYERDCSLQRRHQKVIEEAPAPGIDEETRAAICEAAVRAATAVDYVGAGTIEFIADASEGLRADRIWFMEMNTRLQVEHPVTEEITGVDLVEWQLRVASGEPVPLKQEDISIRGHAVEARIYAENPERGFLPSIGLLRHLRWGWLATDVSRERIETGYLEGDAVSPDYDPMIAKLVVHGPDRKTAIDDLLMLAASSQIWPVKTNLGFLVDVLGLDFFEGPVTTGYLGSKMDFFTAPVPASDQVWQTAAQYMRSQAEPHFPPIEGFRLNAPARVGVALYHDGEGRMVEGDPVNNAAVAQSYGSTIVCFYSGRAYEFTTRADAGGHHSASDGAILAPMPGKVIALDVAEGDTVAKGQRVMVLEAMKMEHALTAPFDGTVAELAARLGAPVQVDTVLAQIEPLPA